MKNLAVMKYKHSMLCLVLLTLSGCAALHPIPGVPARYLAPELRAVSRSNETTIDLSLLAQTPPPQHLVGGGDVLGIYIEGVLGRPGEAPPITVPTSPDLPPAIGYPITVRDDGTLSLPMIGSVDVRGLTIRQVEEKLRYLYITEKQILRAGQDRIIVSLQRPRQVRVLVLRQETGGPGGNEFAQGLSINLGQTKRGNGQTVDLPIYKNDVLHALARTGGLPGLDAENTIYIVRRQPLPHQGAGGINCLPGGGATLAPTPATPVYSPLPPAQPVSYQQPLEAGGIQQVAWQQPQQASQSRTPYQVIEQATQQHQAQNTAPQNQGAGYEQYAPRPTGQPPVAFASGSQANLPPGQTIQPVQVRNFRTSNPLDELRSGMDREETPPVQISWEEDFTPAPHQQLTQPQPYHPQPLPQPGLSYQASQPVMAPGFYPESSRYGGMPSVPGPALQTPQVAASPQYQPEPLSHNPMMPAPAMSSAGAQPYWPETAAQGAILPDEWTQYAYDTSLLDSGNPTINNPNVIKIPIRLKPGQQPDIRPQDVILHDGDIVFIESRETEIFYTGGLLGGGQFTLPRDYDLDVLGAISIAQAANQQQAGRQIGGVSAINGDVTISASNVIILRPTPNGSQVPIKVDLYRAINDPAERVLIKPGDIVMLRYKPLEAVGAFIERNLLESALFGLAASQLPSSN